MLMASHHGTASCQRVLGAVYLIVPAVSLSPGETAMAYQVDCSHGDDFQVQSEDEGEVIEMVKRHAQNKHDMDMSDDEARDMIETT